MFQVKSILWSMLVFGAILCVAAVALGAPASQPVVAPPLALGELLDWVLKLAGIVAVTVIPLLLQWWLGGKVTADQLAAYDKLAGDAVAHAEELGHQAFKRGALRLDGAEKANAAATYVLTTADALKLRPLAEDAVKRLIEAKLGATRAGG